MKIAENIMVFVKEHFDKCRPFEIINGNMYNHCTFPTKKEFRREYRDIPVKALLMDGFDYKAGVYYGDIYSSDGKPYYIFKPTDEPEKTISISNQEGKVNVTLMITSPCCPSSYTYVAMTGKGVEEDMLILKRRIDIIKGSMPHLIDNATEHIEVCVRKHYLMYKIRKLGGKKKGRR